MFGGTLPGTRYKPILVQVLMKLRDPEKPRNTKIYLFTFNTEIIHENFLMLRDNILERLMTRNVCAIVAGPGIGGEHDREREQ